MSESFESTYRQAVVRQTVVLGLVVTGLFMTTETPVESVLVDNTKQHILEPTLHYFGKTAYWENENQDNLAEPAYVQAGSMAVDQTIGRFTHFAAAKAELNGKIFGQTFETSKSVREGLVVNKLKLPELTVANIRSTKNVLYITHLEEAEDVGIDLTNALFELADPEAAQDINGTLRCNSEPQDRDYSGCVTRDTIRSGFFSDAPVIGEDQEREIYNAAELLFDDYAQIEKCHFDSILIPKINEVYETYLADLNIPFRLEGSQRYQQAMEVLVRGFWRDRIKEGRVPQSVFFHLSGNFVPLESVQQRLQHRADTVDFPFEPPKDFDAAYCAKGPDNTLPFIVHGLNLENFDQQITHLAIMGLPVVPNGYNPFTQKFESGSNKYIAPDTSEVLSVTGAAYE